MCCAKPLLRELKDGYWQEWYCEPPPLGSVFRVNPGGDEWDTVNEVPVRRIYEIGICDAAQEVETAGRPAQRPGPAGPGTRPGYGAGAPGTACTAEA